MRACRETQAAGRAGGRSGAFAAAVLVVLAVLSIGPAAAQQGGTGNPAQRVSPDAFELSFWDTIKNSRNPEDFKAYLDTFPNGRFAPLARIRMREGGGTPPPPPPGPSSQGGSTATPPAAGDNAEPLDEERVATASTPILARPVANATRLGTLARGDRVRVTGSLASANLLRILTADGRTGFVAADRLRAAPADSPPAATTPVATTPGSTAPAGRAGDSTVDCTGCPEMVAIPAGSFDMGSNDLFEFEKPVRRVTIARGFLLGRREVTFAEWQLCAADGACVDRSAAAGDPSLPVTDVSWNESKAFAAWLSTRTGRSYRLPTEAEWEYAARAGTKTTYPWGATLERERANCLGCNAVSLRRVTTAGRFPPNGFGLVDMAGNAAEWVEDCWVDTYRGAPGDGSARVVTPCRERVLRGGSFVNDPRYLRSAARFKYDPEVRYYANGLRVARDP